MQPGDSIYGRYRLIDRVGEGGMGIVWRGEQIALGRAVAIKVIHHDDATAEMRSRFQREAELAARVRHRNVIDIIEYGSTEAGDQYLVMPLLEGEAMATRLARRPPPSAREVLDWTRAVLSGLGAIHDAGIVHRDLKPANVFLARDADGVLPKLLDFGISRSAGPRAATNLTQLGTAMGTPQYMAPEQFESARDVDERADVYGAGAILYEALTGRPPFAGADAFAIYRAILGGEPPPLSACRPDLPDALSEIADRALARDPEHRFQSAREMRDAIDAIDTIEEDGADTPGARSSSRGGTPLPRTMAMAQAATGEAETLPATHLGAGRTMAMGASGEPERTSAVDVSAIARESLPGAPSTRSRRPWLAPGGVVLGLLAIVLGASFFAMQVGDAPTDARVTPAIDPAASPPDTPAPPPAPTAHRVGGPERLNELALAWGRLDPALRAGIDIRLGSSSGRWMMITPPGADPARVARLASAMGGTAEPLPEAPERTLGPVLLSTSVRLNVHATPDTFLHRREAQDSSTQRVLMHGTLVIGLRGAVDGDESGGEGEDALTYFVVAPNSAGWALSRFLTPYPSCLPSADRLGADTHADREALSGDTVVARTDITLDGRREDAFVFAGRDRSAARSYVGVYRASGCELRERRALHTIEGVFDEIFFTETARVGGQTLLVVSTHPRPTPPSDGLLDWAAYRLDELAPVWSEQLASAAYVRARERGAVSGSRDRVVRTQAEHYVLATRRPREPRAWYTWDDFEVIATDPPGGEAPEASEASEEPDSDP